jgi:hydroxyquinol 1,2-dioxygenase
LPTPISAKAQGGSMRDLDQFNITDEVIEQLQIAKDPRFKEIMESLVRHLHDFAREVELTPAEWLAGIAFLTQVGQACNQYRQEFILLSDTLGLSACVNAMHSSDVGHDATRSSLQGPFYRDNSPKFALGDTISGNFQGEVIAMTGRVHDKDGKGIPNARVEVWQTDNDGLYDVQMERPEEMHMRGQLRTDKDGRYHFRTLVPKFYSIPVDGPVGDMIRKWGRHPFRPAHIHFLVGAEGHDELVTALYLGDDPNIASDAVYGVSRSLAVDIKPAFTDGPHKGLRHIDYDFCLNRADARRASRRVGADPAAIAAAAV